MSMLKTYELIKAVWEESRKQVKTDHYDQGHYICTTRRNHYSNFHQFWKEAGLELARKYSNPDEDGPSESA